MSKHIISEEIFQKIYGYLRGVGGIHVKNEQKTRLFLEGVFYLLRSGCQIRLLPIEYGNCYTIHARFLYWKRKGIWEKLFKKLQDLDGEYFMIDGTIIRANQCAAGYSKDSKEDLGRSCGGFSTKIHALVDALGNPVEFILSPGNEHDVTHAEELTKDLKNTKVLADKGYDSKKLIDFLEKNNCEAVIPSRSNSKEI